MSRAVFLVLILLASFSLNAQDVVDQYGALVRSDTLKKQIYLCFTGHDYYDGFEHVLRVLKRKNVEASFFLTGDFVRTHPDLVKRIARKGHYVGAHSDKHLLYCDWNRRDSLLHTQEKIRNDILHNLEALLALGITSKYFMPPYEWYNREVVDLASVCDQITLNYSPGTRSAADYTTPDLANYISSAQILESIYQYEKSNGLNGFHLLIHPGTSPLRTDKLYLHLEELITALQAKGYGFARF